MMTGQKQRHPGQGWDQDGRGSSQAKPVLDRLQEMLGALPGIGPKSAERIAHHLLAAPRDEVLELAETLRAVKEKLRRCARCCAPTGG